MLDVLMRLCYLALVAHPRSLALWRTWAALSQGRITAAKILRVAEIENN